jgi:hypothetical protein
MSVSLNASRNDCICTIIKNEVEQITRTSIEHFALPIIAGYSLDGISQETYAKMGGKGLKPTVVSQEAKLEMYRRIKAFFNEIITNKVTQLVTLALEGTLKSFSDEELNARIKAISDRAIVLEPNWDSLASLFKDHTFSFKQLKHTSLLHDKVVSLHDVLCPIMCAYRDSGELYVKINLKEFLPR